MSPAALTTAAQNSQAHRRSDAQVAGDEHRAVHDVEAAGGVAGRERRVARDHDQLVAALRQLPQRRLALCGGTATLSPPCTYDRQQQQAGSSQ